ncbi:hypothetical protein [Microcoleus sp. FACHB-831]|nr:hypothetical protein [Microcoleus sp. FACHB-831]
MKEAVIVAIIPNSRAVELLSRFTQFSSIQRDILSISGDGDRFYV